MGKHPLYGPDKVRRLQMERDLARLRTENERLREAAHKADVTCRELAWWTKPIAPPDELAQPARARDAAWLDAGCGMGAASRRGRGGRVKRAWAIIVATAAYGGANLVLLDRPDIGLALLGVAAFWAVVFGRLKVRGQ